MNVFQDLNVFIFLFISFFYKLSRHFFYEDNGYFVCNQDYEEHI